MRRRSDSRKLDRSRTVRAVQIRPQPLRTRPTETPLVRRYQFRVYDWGFYVMPIFNSRNFLFLTPRYRVNKPYYWRW